MPQALSLRAARRRARRRRRRDRHGRAPAQPAGRPGRERRALARRARAVHAEPRPAGARAQPAGRRAERCGDLGARRPLARRGGRAAARRRHSGDRRAALRRGLAPPARAELAGDEARLARARPRAGLRAPRRHVHRGHAEQGACATASARRAPPSSPASCRCPSSASTAAAICAMRRSRRCGASGRRPPEASGWAMRRAARARRSCCCTTCAARRHCAASPALVRREHRTGVHATYVMQTRYLADARGAPLVGPALERLVRDVRKSSGDVIAGGVAGGPLANVPRGSGAEFYPTYAAAFASPTEVDGETLSGELRVSRYVLGRARSRRRGGLPRRLRRDAARLRGRGRGDGHRRGRDALGGCRRRRVPVLAGAGGRPRAPPAALSGGLDDVPGEGPAAALAASFVALRRNRGSGAPTLVELTPDRHGCAAAVERALLADTPADVWRGTLDRLGRFWEQRAGLGLDARPLGAGRGWLVRVRSEHRASGQSLVAPFRVARAVGPDGHPLAVSGGQSRRAAGLPRGDRRRPRPRAREGQPDGGSWGSRIPPSCDSAPAAAHTPLKLRTRLSIGSLRRGTHHRRRNP